MWEAISAVATVFTGIVIAVTVLVGSRQLRAMNRQLEHFQSATQLDGTLKVYEILIGRQFQEAQHFVFNELSDRLRDERYRSDAENVSNLDLSLHKERFLLHVFEEIGALVRHKLLNSDVIYDVFSSLIIGAWNRMSQLIAVQRQNYGGDELWENFEYLYRGAMQAEALPAPGTRTSSSI
jgi:hypothetical protein